jgi:hypothetical protein
MGQWQLLVGELHSRPHFVRVLSESKVTEPKGCTGSVEVHAAIGGAGGQGQLALSLSLIDLDDDNEIASHHVSVPAGCREIHCIFGVGEIDLWWPHTLGTQKRYQLVLRLKLGTETIDQRSHMIGFRHCEFQTDTELSSDQRLLHIAGNAVLLRGYRWTVPSWHAAVTQPQVSGEYYRHVLEEIKRCGANCVYLGGVETIERDIFYSLCDELGLLVWHDDPAPLSDATSSTGGHTLSEQLCHYRWGALRRHPSLVVSAEADLSPRVLDDSSGWTDPAGQTTQERDYFRQISQARLQRHGIEAERVQWPHLTGVIVPMNQPDIPICSLSPRAMSLLYEAAAGQDPVWSTTREAFRDHLVVICPSSQALAQTRQTGEQSLVSPPWFNIEKFDDFRHWKLNLVNQGITDWEVIVTVQRVTLAGKLRSRMVIAPVVGVNQIVEWPLPPDVVHPSAVDELLIVDWRSPSGLGRSVLAYAPDHELRYQQPRYDVLVDDRGQGRYDVTVFAHSLLRDLTLRADYFDPHAVTVQGPTTLLPGESMTWRLEGLTKLITADNICSPVLICANQIYTHDTVTGDLDRLLN